MFWALGGIVLLNLIGRFPKGDDDSDVDRTARIAVVSRQARADRS